MRCRATTWTARPTSSPRWGWRRCAKGTKSCWINSIRPSSITRASRLFSRNTNRREINVRLEPQYILAFFRSMYQLGIQGVERAQYWKLMMWTLFRKPQLCFPGNHVIHLWLSLSPGGRVARPVVRSPHTPKANRGRREKNSLRPLCLGVSRLIHLIDHAQSHQRQVWLHHLDHIRFGGNDFRQSAGGDDARATAQLRRASA